MCRRDTTRTNNFLVIRKLKDSGSYPASPCNVQFVLGETEKTVSVPVLDDAEEDSGETLTLTLSNPTGAVLGDNEATGTIYNDEDGMAAQQALTASFSGLPGAHDGSAAFSFTLTFSEEVAGLDAAALKDSALEVSGGTVTKAERDTGGSDGSWTVEVEPDGDGAVDIALPATTDCAATGALCTGDGAMLSEAVSATVPGPAAVLPLTASFRRVPDAHDGWSPFEVRVRFSEAPKAGIRRIAESVDVAGGSLTKVLRVTRGDNTRWTLRLKPSGAGAVEVSLPGTEGACDAFPAICTADGRALSEAVEVTVPGPASETPAVLPLTASFSDLPSEHDGESAFTFTLTFSEDVEGLSHGTLRDSAFEVSGASVTKAKRRTQGSNESWTIHVEPDGNEAVTVVLPETTDCAAAGAICAGDGRKLSNASRATVRGPPGLSVADAEVNEGASDAALAFVVTLDRAASGTATVAYETEDGTATAPADYEETSGTLTFAAGETSHTVSVPVHGDELDEGDETLTLTLSNPTGAYLADATATGTIENTGHIPQAWIARFGRAVADQVLDAVDARLRTARAPGVEATVAGQTLSFDTASEDAGALQAREDDARAEALTAWLRGEDGEADRAALSGTQAVSERELFTGTSFALTGGSPEEGTVSAWGRGVLSNFDGREGELTLDGEVGNLMLGVDVTRGRATAGLMLSHARGSGGYRGASAGGIEASLTGLYPYGRYAVSDRVSVWGVAGYGEGTLTVEPEGQATLETDMDLAMASVGMRGVLVQAPPEGGAELAVKSDAMAVRTTSEAVRTGTGNMAAAQADVTRLRLGLEGSRAFGFAGGASFTPSVELGVRHDGGDAETGLGADIGAGLAWSDPARGMSAGLRARGLLTHEDGSFSERGFAGSLAWDPAPGSARGPSLSIAQTVGAQASGGVEALLGPQTAQALEAANDNDGNELERRSLEAKLGFGFALFDDRYTGTPELRLGLTGTSRETVLGWRLAEERRTGLVFGLDVEGARRESGDADPVHRLGLDFGWRLEGAGTETFEVRFEGSRFEPANDSGSGSGAGAEHRIGLTLTSRW